MDTNKLVACEKEWSEKTLSPWVEKYGERSAEFTASKGMIPVKALYTPLDLEEGGVDYIEDIGFPGQYPYTRGNEPNMYRRKFWEMSQYSGFGSADETNRRIKDLLTRGLSGIFIALDLPTQIGYDSDHFLARQEVGKCGVAFDSLEDMERIFDGIPLEKMTSIRTTANAIAPIWIAMLLALCEKQGIDPDRIHGGTQNDILKEYAGRGTQIFPIKASLKFTTDAVEYCVRNLPNWSPLQISGEHMASMGAKPIEGVAFSLANAIQYLECAIERGVNVDDVASKNEFLVSARGENLLEDVAKFRAIRRMWARILKERFGAKNPKSMMMHIVGFGSGAPLTYQEPMNNIIRTTIQGLALSLGGVPSMNLPSYDEALSLPSEQAARLAVRTQQIIAYESGVADTVDPLGGSYYLEYLTDQIEKKAMGLIKKIDEMGKAAIAIENGYYETLINRSLYENFKEMQSCKRIKVAVNKFQSDEKGTENPVKAFKGKAEEEKKQIERLVELKKKRNKQKVQKTLENLASVASDDKNTIPAILEAVKSYATVGEICDTLRQVWGRWEAKPSMSLR
ncbi:methylmalonyl-CoA mutase family protein [uncultured Desulfosarcina sp.]|uniref:acyl-CoA mutase large subunit family protein n=1 Tax=uncultured Desulfosarcina sp. TaxID=218289 RepID=UPI0029C74313|nr:methylmalonyl-CoA mutase family protein [uncultured Desulfosarcina sp.]